LIGLPGRQQVVLRQLAWLEALADGEEAETRPFQPRLEAEPLQA
jgi:hypothetical protein